MEHESKENMPVPIQAGGNIVREGHVIYEEMENRNGGTRK